MPNKKYNNFDMTLEECRQVLDLIDRLVVVDRDNRIKYVSKELLELNEFIGMKDLSSPIGMKIEDVNPFSKIGKVLRSGEKIDQCYYHAGGVINIARIKPIVSEGKVIGAIDYDIFSDDKALRSFLNELNEMAKNGIIDITKDLGHAIRSAEEFSKKFKYKVGSIKGESIQIKKLKQQIYDLSESDSTVLITGETGTGKELIAQAIHNISKRSQKRIVEINCAAIPESLAESELFGYEDGSFTGAHKGGKIGKFEQANGGTVFLDEIDHLPYHIQPKLLRFLQEREIDRIGGSESIPVDVRLIVATNKDLKEMSLSDKFREDLYYRLNVVEIKVPPLRDRKEDISILVNDAIQRINSFLGKSICGIDAEALDALCRYDWPGNVRELLNVMERAMNKCKEDKLSLAHFDDFLFQMSRQRNKAMLSESNSALEQIRDMAEGDAIRYSLNLTGGNITKTAGLLKISRPALYYKMKKLGIDPASVKI